MLDSPLSPMTCQNIPLAKLRLPVLTGACIHSIQKVFTEQAEKTGHMTRATSGPSFKDDYAVALRQMIPLSFSVPRPTAHTRRNHTLQAHAWTHRQADWQMVAALGLSPKALQNRCGHGFSYKKKLFRVSKTQNKITFLKSLKQHVYKAKYILDEMLYLESYNMTCVSNNI